jgi:hypothetical protein
MAMKTMLALMVMCGTVLAQDGVGKVDPHKEGILNKLNTMRVTVDFKDTPLDEVLNYLRDFTGLNIVVDPEVSTKFTLDQLKVTLRVNDLLLKSTLKLMLGSRELAALYKDGVILIVPKGRIDKAVSLQLYNVQDLLAKIQDFPGPRVELVSPQAGGGGLAGAIFVPPDDTPPKITEEFILETVKRHTGEKNWDENPNASITLTNGMLVVSQSRRVHEEIRKLLHLLRQFK